MTNSAKTSLGATTPTPTTKRERTHLAIHTAALDLAEQHGLNGFTLDDLALKADVSRRTLFNYFPSKEAAVLGIPVEGLFPQEAREAYLKGDFSYANSYLDELIELLKASSEAFTRSYTHDNFLRLTAVLAQEPKVAELFLARHDKDRATLKHLLEQRYSSLSEEDIELILALFFTCHQIIAQSTIKQGMPPQADSIARVYASISALFSSPRPE